MPTPPFDRSSDANRRSSLLIIRPGAIGDCLQALPAIHWLMESARSAAGGDCTQIEVWVPTPVMPLISGASRVYSIASTGLDQFGIGDRPPPVPLLGRLCSFDRIVSWYGANREEFRAAAAAIHPHWEFLDALPPPESALHAADYFASQVGAPLGGAPALQIDSAVPRHNRIAIHPFSGSKSKNWPLERYLALVERLPADVTQRVTFLAGPEESLEGALRFDNLAELARGLAGARLYIGNDSGISHLAAAAGTSSLVLFGPTDPAIWAPRGRDVVIMRHQPIGELPVAAVRDQILKLLDV